MKTTLFIHKIVILLALIMILNTAHSREIEYSGDFTAVSTYVWRGVKQFDGLALQGSFGASYDAISIGLWYSSVNFGADTPFFETDPYVEVALPTGPVSSAFGATLYAYDFSKFNDDADIEYEIYGKAGYNIFEIAAFYVPSQASLENDVVDTAYWLRVSAAKTMGILDLNLMFESGTYSSRFLSTPKKDPVNVLTMGISRTLAQIINIGWNYSLAASSGMENTLWLNLGMAF
jgi:uncharacterized protein (TIGR02001 family)